MKKKEFLTAKQIRKMTKREAQEAVSSNKYIMDIKAAEAFREKLKERE